MNRKQFEQAETILNDSVGPFTNALNEFFKRSRGTPFFDHIFFQIESFYLMYTKRVWKDQMWVKSKSSIIREFEDEDMELANKCLYQFQTLCDQEGLSTRNPISFFNSLDAYWQDESKDFPTVAALYLWAVTDRKFLFDSAIQGFVPSLFITRAFVSQLKTEDNILRSPVLSNSKFGSPQGSGYWAMQEQIRNFHLMLPSRIDYCDRWTDSTLPIVRKMQNLNQMYYNVGRNEPDELISSSCHQQLVNAVMECFICYVASLKHLDEEGQADLERKVAYLRMKQGSSEHNEFKEIIGQIVNLIAAGPQAWAFPFFLYRILTR